MGRRATLFLAKDFASAVAHGIWLAEGRPVPPPLVAAARPAIILCCLTALVPLLFALALYGRRGVVLP